MFFVFLFFFSSRRRHTRWPRDWSSDVCSSDLFNPGAGLELDTTETVDVPENPEITSILLNIVTENILTAFTELNLLGIIFTAGVFGIAIALLRSQKLNEEFGNIRCGFVQGFKDASLNKLS